MSEQGDPGGSARTCAWCSAAVAATDATCPACGAAVAQREELGGILIPGVTGVDPGLAAFDAQPTHIKGPSPTQGLASGVIPAAALGGPAGLAILGGIAAVAAAEYLSARGPNGEALDHRRVGELGGVAQLALDKVARDGGVERVADAPEDAGTDGAAESPSVDHTWDMPEPEPGA
jgi:hypothetical protein